MAEQNDLIAQTLSVLDRVRDAAPSFPQGNTRDLVVRGEAKVALENLCDNLFELGVQLPTSTKKALVEVCKCAAVSEAYWRDFGADGTSPSGA